MNGISGPLSAFPSFIWTTMNVSPRSADTNVNESPTAVSVGWSQLVPATSFWNRGFFRSGSKLGSILSHAGDR